VNLVANARMYAVDAATSAAWSALFSRLAALSSVPLDIVAHAAPAPLEDLWRRDDLGLAFMCGYPFASCRFDVRPVAAPVPASGNGAPLYATHLVVRTESDIATLQDSFGYRIGWTVAHSQSGFNAVRTHLMGDWRERGQLYGGSVGPLLTPRRVVEALLTERIDIGPLDSYFYDLLLVTEPETVARLRIVATTVPRPMPLLVASQAVEDGVVAPLQQALLTIADDPAGREILARLRLTGFQVVETESYRMLVREAQAADAAGYGQPG